MPYKDLEIHDVDNNDLINCQYIEIAVCPICQHALVPQPLDGYLIRHIENNPQVYISFFCPRCRNVFLTHYATYFISRVPTALKSSDILGIYPRAISGTGFSSSIEKVSPMFVTTYNQSEAAEAEGLTEVAGCGYRKSLEYLVKDYLCHQSPQQSENIKAEFLGGSIKRIGEDRIRILAERATWLGNDATHYVKKHENLDINDMKNFISAMLHYIEAELTFEDALAVPFKK